MMAIQNTDITIHGSTLHRAGHRKDRVYHGANLAGLGAP